MRVLVVTPILLFACLTTSAQTLIFSYLFEYKTDPAKAWNRDLSLCVEVDSLGVLCYSENEYLRDSIGYTIMDAGLGHYVASEEKKRFPRGVQWSIFGNPSTGKFTHYDYYITLNFTAEDYYQTPQWEISEDTEEICGYLCRKAVSKYYGRLWTVWYAEEIPIGSGPWLLWGTPGMILKAEDSQMLFRFSCENIVATNFSRRSSVLSHINRNCSDSAAIIMTGSMKEVEALRTKYNRDVQAYYDIMGFQIRSFDADGKPMELPKYRPYIPLIPDEYWENL